MFHLTYTHGQQGKYNAKNADNKMKLAILM